MPAIMTIGGVASKENTSTKLKPHKSELKMTFFKNLEELGNQLHVWPFIYRVGCNNRVMLFLAVLDSVLRVYTCSDPSIIRTSSVINLLSE